MFSRVSRVRKLARKRSDRACGPGRKRPQLGVRAHFAVRRSPTRRIRALFRLPTPDILHHLTLFEIADRHLNRYPHDK